MIEEIKNGNVILAVIIHSEYHDNGIKFFTPPEFSQQLAYMNRPAGYRVTAHVHNKVQRTVQYTLETLFIKKGKVRLDLYDDSHEYIGSRIVVKGDVVLLASGGHGLTMIEDTEIIEVKQGPHAGEADKTRFESAVEEFIPVEV